MVITTIMTMTMILIALFGTRDHIDSAIMLTGTITPCIGPASQSNVLHVRACARHCHQPPKQMASGSGHSLAGQYS
jgi:hypothetical protein